MGGVYGPDDPEFVHPLAPPLFRALTPTTYVLLLSAPMLMLVPEWLYAARLQLFFPSEL